MSNYLINTKHPITGEFMPAEWLDDYQKHHQYGVRFLGEDKIYIPDTMNVLFETNDDPVTDVDMEALGFAEPSYRKNNKGMITIKELDCTKKTYRTWIDVEGGSQTIDLSEEAFKDLVKSYPEEVKEFLNPKL